MTSGWNIVRLRITTPAFIGGSRSRSADAHHPFRAPSVRGVLRTWFRAAATSCLAVPEGPRAAGLKALEDALRDAEGRLFGHISGDGPRASSLILRPCPPGHGGETIRLRRPSRHGLLYAGYGLFEDKHRDAEAVDTGGAAEIHLPMRLRADAPPLAAEVLAATLWLWTHLGGIGARSRRGWGSLELLDLGGLPWQGPAAGAPVANRGEAFNRINDGLDAALAIFRRYLHQNDQDGLMRGQDRHPAVRGLHGIAAIRGLPHTWGHPLDALDDMGLLLRDFRSTVERSRRGLAPLPDYFTVKDALSGAGPIPATVERTAFGLPLPFYFRSLGGAKTRFTASDGDRMASPLLFRVLRVGPGEQWGGMMLHLAENAPSPGGRIHPLGGTAVLQDGRASRVVAEPDGGLIVEFMDWALRETRRRHATAVGGRR